MKMSNKPSIFLGLMITFFFLAIGLNNLGNIQSNNAILANPTTQIIVSSASSLKEVMEEIKPLYEQKYRKTIITYNYGSSGSLQQQIEQGAHVYVFISAANKQIDTLAQKNLLLVLHRQDLVTNQIVLVVPKNGEKNISKIDNFKNLTNKNLDAIDLVEPQIVTA